MASYTIPFDMIQTLALAGVVLFLGYGVRRRVWFLDRYNIPAPVVGGFIFAFLALVLRLTNVVAFQFDTTLQTPLMIAFFTTIGLGASVALLRVGGPQVILFWILASTLAIMQGGVGLGLAATLGLEPLVGLITGSISMTGGHGTGAAFGQLLEESYGVTGGLTLAMAAATFGLVSGGLIGGPIATRIITRRRFRQAVAGVPQAAVMGNVQVALERPAEVKPKEEGATSYGLLKTMTIILLAMAVGGLFGAWVQQSVRLPSVTLFGYTLGGGPLTLPAYIGAMIVAAVLRNLDEGVAWLRKGRAVLGIEQRVVDNLGMIALSLFLAMALMSLRLWELLDLAVPMLIILSAQVLMMGTFAYFITFRVMGRDYDAAVMAGGHCGFGLGATPNAVANMEAIVERFGPAPRAFLVLPMVGAFFIDFTNAMIITIYINLVT
jgi:glutamate:Na+ symporter, ESS family